MPRAERLRRRRRADDQGGGDRQDARDRFWQVGGDPRLRRPYLVEVSSSVALAAHDLAAYLRSQETQPWTATFKRVAFDDQPLFFAVNVP
jgi:hypothetical protein